MVRAQICLAEECPGSVKTPALEQFAPDKWLKSLELLFSLLWQGNSAFLTGLPGSVKSRSRKQISKSMVL